ncbi:hypothetical protein AB870_21985 [Pandoraea faecigallinarum]|uniref:Big-1 domain-containing protein n=1 Tax=Pandoraea faecigallinarum TaxID=656179 RepID=A0A0H3WWV2_9BURK|nr:Tc toxin subunit A [Pandoraea faecigallinarum]AKM32217.1 hypothetical protein AB870_21985 [Pandoraea faecigallinarum]
MARQPKAASSASYTSPLLERLTTTHSDAAREAARTAADTVALGSLSVRQLLDRHPGLHIDEARVLQQRAAAAAIVVARQFRERELTRSERKSPDFVPGFETLTHGPQYSNLFDEDWAAMARPRAIEARTSPVAYLLTLYRRARAIETSGTGGTFRLKLDERRPDIADEIIDEKAFTEEIPALSVSTRVLEYAISAYLKVLSGDPEEAPDIDLAMSEVRYPMSMPYEHWATQIREILALARGQVLTLGEVARQVDPGYHYFAHRMMQTSWGDNAMRLSLPVGPARQKLLTAPFFSGTGSGEDDSRFYRETYGVGGLPELVDTAVFCARTHTSATHLARLFAVQSAAPVASDNVPDLPPASAAAFGAVYLNAAQTPAIAIEAGAPPAPLRSEARKEGPEGEAEETAEDVDPPHYFTELTVNRADRIHRVIRLSRWLDIGYPETDRLIMAAHIAQHRSGAPAITTSTLRALGVFCDFRARYDVTAEDFAAWMSTVAPYGLRDDAGPSQFDRIFNEPRTHSMPLVLDGGPIETGIGFDQATGMAAAQHIAVALGLDPDEFAYLARTISAQMQGRVLTRSLDVVSAFFRIASLARYLGLSPTVLLGLLETLGLDGTPIVGQMAGTPRIHSIPTIGDTDFLSALVAAEGCVRWCRDKAIDIAWMIRHLRPPSTPDSAGMPEQTLIQSLRNQLSSTRITLGQLYEAGIPQTIFVPVTPGGPDQEITPEWLCQLGDVVDPEGIVLDGVSGTDEDFASSAAEIIRDAVSALFMGEVRVCANGLSSGFTRLSKPVRNDDIPAEKRPLMEQIIATLGAIVLRSRAAQRAIVEEHVSGYLGLASELVLPLIDWAGQSAYEILRWSWSTPPVPSATMARRQIDAILTWSQASTQNGPPRQAEGSEVMLQRLSELRRQAEIVTHFSLDGAMLAMHAHNARLGESGGRNAFGFAPAAKTFRDFYYLQTYRDVVERGHGSPADLLTYLTLINTPGIVDEDAIEVNDGYARLMRDAAAGRVASLVGAGARDVLDAARIVSPLGIIRQLTEFTGLLRLLHLSQVTGLSIVALDRLGQLTETGTVSDYRQAAQDALACMSVSDDANASGQREVTPEVGQSATSTCTVSKTVLVANDDDADNEAHYALTIRDLAGAPLAGIPVRWSQSGAGVIQSEATTTDADGVAHLTLYPGLVMGMAYAFATIGLDQRIALPAVRIDCDEASLEVYDDTDALPPEENLAGERELVHLHAYVKDNYENMAIGREVRWDIAEGPGRLLRTTSFTDQYGFAHSAMVSRETGTSTVVVRYNNSAATFTNINFVDQPFIDSSFGIRAVSAQLAGGEVTVLCRVLSLTGAPVQGETVVFTVDGENAGSAESESDGYVRLSIEPAAVGTIVVGASLHGRHVQTPLDIVGGPVASPIVALHQRVVQDPQKLGHVGILVQASEFPEPAEPSGELPPIAHMDVAWDRQDSLDVVVPTDLSGHSRTSASLANAGTYTFTATPTGLTPIAFTVTVVPVPRWTITLDGVEVTDRLSLRVGQTYVLHVAPANGQDHLLDQDVLLSWEGANPTGQGLLATPSYMQMREMPADGLRWTLECTREPSETARFAIGVRLVDPYHVHWMNVRIFPAAPL